MNTILVTGCAGFIGSHLTEKLLERGDRVVGVDNFDPFYPREIKENNIKGFVGNSNFRFYELNLAEAEELQQISESVDLIVHLAGRAGVRPSIEDPHGYIINNIVATRNVLEFMREHGVSKMAFASSSSVYGNCPNIPFVEDEKVDNPVSPYAFTKKSCEMINYTYHHLYEKDIINMRFFTVYGPRQRPDLAIHKFMRLLRQGEEITMFGDGTTARDYTYIDDTVSGIVKTCDFLLANDGIYDTINLGNSFPVLLSDLIEILSNEAHVVPCIDQQPMQAGDVKQTFADISHARQLVGYDPQIPFEEGIRKFVAWFDSQQ